MPSFEDDFTHNIWNPLLELLFHEQVSGVFEPFVDDIDLARIALSCHFATVLQRKRVWYCITLHWAPLSMEYLYCYPVTSDYLSFWYLEHSATAAVNWHTHSPLIQVGDMDSLQVGSRMETRKAILVLTPSRL